MKCPKCGYQPKADDRAYVPANECPSCGIIYDKHEDLDRFQKKNPKQSSPVGHPSPVSAESLKKARDRVERRLYKQQIANHRDSRHIKTLKLARRLTSEGVRQRQTEWEKQQSQEMTSASPPETSQPTPMEEAQVSESQGLHEEAAAIHVIEDDIQEVPTLKEMLNDDQPTESKQTTVAHLMHRSNARFSGSLMRLLPLVAWMILCTGVIGALLSWTTLANAQSDMQLPAAMGLNSLPLGLLLGFAYLATGVLGFAFFWVSSRISNQLKDIKRLLLLKSTVQDESKEDQQD